MPRKADDASSIQGSIRYDIGLILTLTMNPAIDRNVTVDKLVFDDRAYILSTRESAGGRGINASYVLHSFGVGTRAIAICGGRAGKRLEEFLNESAYETELVRVRNEIRTNITIADRSGLAVKLNELGPELSAAEVQRVEKTVRKNLASAKWLMLSGSLPRNVPEDFYARLVHAANKRNVPVLLDADGPPLEAALAERPAIVSPNQQEAERLLDRVLITRSHFFEAAERIRAMGAGGVVLSLGARGAAISMPDGRLVEVLPPRVDALCPIGSGDALAAAVVWSMSNGGDLVEATRWGVAAGTASAQLPGVSFASFAQTQEIYRSVEVRPYA